MCTASNTVIEYISCCATCRLWQSAGGHWLPPRLTRGFGEGWALCLLLFVSGCSPRAAIFSSRTVQTTDFNLDWAVGFHIRFNFTNQKRLWLILVVPLHVLLRLARNFWFKLFLVNKMGMSPDNVSCRREDLHGSWSTMSTFGGLLNPVLSTPLVSEHPELAFFQTNADTCTSRSKSLLRSSETARGSTFQLHPLGQATRQSSPVLRCYWPCDVSLSHAQK